MATRAITVHLPEEAVKELEQTAKKRKLKLDDMLAHLIEDSLRRERWEKRIAELTLAYLGEKPCVGHSISEIKVDAEKVARAMIETYGTDDIIEIINMSRWRGGKL